MKAKKNTRQRSEQMRQVSAGLRDVLGMTQWRKEHPKATWAEIEAVVDERINQVRAQTDPGPGADGGERSVEAEAGSGASQVCDLRPAALGAENRRASSKPMEGKRSS